MGNDSEHWKAPACGGQLTPEQKARDRAARLIISRELGHEREQITARRSSSERREFPE